MYRKANGVQTELQTDRQIQLQRSFAPKKKANKKNVEIFGKVKTECRISFFLTMRV